MRQFLVTGAAGFIGLHATLALLKQEQDSVIVGIDNMKNYDITLKQSRLAQLTSDPNFIFYQYDIAFSQDMNRLTSRHPNITRVLHLAAQAGVRHVLTHPLDYANAALKKLEDFLHTGLRGYKKGRDYPGRHHTSKLSAHLHFGEISPHHIWNAVKNIPTSHGFQEDIEHFLSELIWREFSCYLLTYYKDLPYDNFQPKFNGFPWEDNALLLKAWQSGNTGYPIVDAGMRQLWQTGYMHNRVRMIVAFFLVKNLMIHWHQGRDWFWECLVDGDLANNSASWQWVAGCGADAAPYFRIFNPILQGEKFDSPGEYTQTFVPELKHLPKEYLFNPWKAPDTVLKIPGLF